MKSIEILEDKNTSSELKEERSDVKSVATAKKVNF